MSKRPDDPPAIFLEEVASGVSPATAHAADPITPAFAAERREGMGIDWRTIDPSAIQGEGIPVEELRFYREMIDELLTSDAGRYVLIAGHKFIGSYPDFESAARYAVAHFDGKSVLVKKVVEVEPVQTLGGAIGLYK